MTSFTKNQMNKEQREPRSRDFTREYKSLKNQLSPYVVYESKVEECKERYEKLFNETRYDSYFKLVRS